jgi:hypothetical protein
MNRLQVADQGSAIRNSLAEAMKELAVAVLPAPKITKRSNAVRQLGNTGHGGRADDAQRGVTNLG